MSLPGAMVCVGVFDGVHRGHAALLGATRDAAAERGMHATAIVLDPPPIELLNAGDRVARLCPPHETVRRIAGYGIEPMLVNFTPAIRDLDPTGFFDALRPSLDVRGVVMTPLSAFGRDRSGTPTHLRGQGFEVIEVAPQVVDGALISSSRIRSEIAAGQVEDAGNMLGRQTGMWGTVVHGDGRGRDLGYPTANLSFDYLPALPAVGIYLGTAGTAERGFLPALVSVGRRPTFGAAGAVLVEAHILDWNGDLYDQELTVTVAARLRDEERFPSVEALVAQMRRDEANARARLEVWSEAEVGPV